MTQDEATLYARMEAKSHGCGDVAVAWYEMRQLGVADIEQNTIFLSYKLLGKPATLREVVLHEIAHFLDFRQRGSLRNPHGKNWQTICRQLGIPARCHIPV